MLPYVLATTPGRKVMGTTYPGRPEPGSTKSPYLLQGSLPPPSEWIQCCHKPCALAVSEESCLDSKTHKDIGSKSQGETHAVGEVPVVGPGWNSSFMLPPLLLCLRTHLAES